MTDDLHAANMRAAMSAALAKRRLDPGTCDWEGCTLPAFCFQWIGGDPSGYCSDHANELAEFWIRHGLPPVPYIRLADGQIFTYTVARSADAD